MTSLSQSQDYQSKLARFCRTGQMEPIPSTHSANIPEYRRLVYQVNADMIINAFPLFFELLGEEEFHLQIQDFLQNHACQSAQVWKMPEEFADYILENKIDLLDKYPFLPDLLWLEWIEVELFMMQDLIEDYPKTILLKEAILHLNPEHFIRENQFPVHQKNPREISAKDQDYFAIIAHRDQSGEVIFNQVSPTVLWILLLLKEEAQTFADLLFQFETKFNLKISKEDLLALEQFFAEGIETNLIV